MGIIVKFDRCVLNFVYNRVKNRFLDKLIPIISKTGNGGLIWISVAVIFLFIGEYRRAGTAVLFAIALCAVVCNAAMKPLFARKRPFDSENLELLIRIPTDFSFPSGHTMSSFAAATAIIHFNLFLGIVAYIWAALIGFSRLYMYVHYPTDVLAGVLFGVPVGIISIKLSELAFASF